MKTLNTLFAAVAIITALGFSKVTAQDNETPFSLMAHVNGVGQDKIKDVAVSSDGSIYFIMEYATDITIFNHNFKNGGKIDAALVKLNSDGTFAWEQTVSSTGNDYGYAVSLNTDQNLIATAFAYSNGANFTGETLVSQGYIDILTAVFDVNGSLVWQKTAGSTNFDFPGDVTFDLKGNVIATGWFSAIATFTDVAVATRQHNDVYLVKYDVEGNTTWVKTLGGNGSDVANSITVNDHNEYVIVGQFEQNITDGNLSAVSYGSFDSYIAVYNEDGSLDHLKSFGSTAADVAYAVKADAFGNYYVVGYFAANLSYDSNILNNNGYDDGFIAKIDESLNLTWFHTVGGNAWDYVRDVVVANDQSEVYITGYFSDIMILGNNTLVAAGGQYDYDMFVAQISASGEIGYATSMGGVSSDFAYKAAIYPDGQVLIGGEFYASFDKQNININAAGGADGILVRFGVKKVTLMQIETSVQSGLDTVTVFLTANNASDLAYMSYEMNYNAELFTYIGTQVADSKKSGTLAIEGEIMPGTIGFAIGKTNANLDLSGEVLAISFTRTTYSEINEEITFTNVLFQNSNMEDMNAEFNTSVTVLMPAALNVWPGDTDNSGSVDEQDVLALAYYWGETGNSRQNASLTWSAQELYAWENEPATYSDTDGQGLVNQNDLRAIVANYGKTTESEFIQKVVRNNETQSEITLTMPAMNKGDHSFVELYATERMEITALSFKVNSSRSLNEYFKIVETNAGNWASNWEKSNQFISFTQQNDQEIGVALSALGSKERQTIEAGELLVSIKVEALAAITDDFEINLSNPSVRTANGQLTSISESASVLVNSTTTTALNEDAENNVQSFELLGNYPNPFNPSTSVRFQLAERSDVSVRVYDIQGKEVAVLAEGSFGAGVNEVPFFAANLSSGTYLYTVHAGNEVKTSKMTLVK